MVTNLKSLIILQIKKVFGPLKVYDEPIKQGLKTPAFQLLILDTVQERKLNRNALRTYQINVNYFPGTADKRGECDATLETFLDEFRYIADKHHVHNIQGEFVDEVLVITSEIKIRVEEISDEILMQTLKFGGVTSE
ncbi:hypothetical protein FQ087_18285 [Sporosarcina sp. ANT_H38]|uniref:phage tail terminator family protein n=1 Tax=Sporosarcina sp. ANT_H38 TaxID=2597358 RepID=UPI0011F2C6C3|nr:hypothetical protein [Sporosarcina sp. ANT_H38]KAA0944075.1 hypothetical protein FQ087_18285 [Sporosarcina sp. ANT_H38]